MTEAPYRRIAAELRARIESGELQPGDQLPSEAQLMDIHGVARMTVRSAVRELTEAGLAVAQHGRGVFVAVPPAPLVERDVGDLTNGELVDLLGRVAAEATRRWGLPGTAKDEA